MKIVRIIRIDFDSMENHEPISKKEISVFFDEPNKSAFEKARYWLHNTYKAPNLYIGYDHKVYPQYEITEKEAI